MIDIISDEEVQSLLHPREQIEPTISSKSESVKQEETSKIPLVDIKELPSGFKGYPQGTKIYYEPLNLSELETLNTGSTDVLRGIALLLKSIHCNTLNAEDLYYWDVMYIGIKRKLLAFGETSGIIYAQCPKCGEVVEHEFNYTEIEFKELEAPDLPIITTLGGKEVEIGLITLKEFLDVDIEKGALDIYARMIKNLPYEESYELISKLTGKDMSKMLFIDKKLNYGMKPFFEECNNIIDTENPNFDANKKEGKGNLKTKKERCGERVRLEVRSPFEVVFPENKDFGYLETEIQYGRK